VDLLDTALSDALASSFSVQGAGTFQRPVLASGVNRISAT
jgi:hypothetical protein